MFQRTFDLVGSYPFDLLMASFTSTGDTRWSHRFASGADGGSSVAVDGSGSVYIAGYFRGTIDFGGGPLTSTIEHDGIFVAGFTGSGTHRWSHHFGSSDDERGIGVAVDASGIVYVTGNFKDIVDFGGVPLTSTGGSDIFVASFTSTGTHRWSRRFGSLFDEGGFGAAVDVGGNVYVTGFFEATVDFGGGPLSSVGSDDIFVASFTSSGAPRWSRGFGSLPDDEGQSVAVDASGNVYVTGFFSRTVDFGEGPLNSAGSMDIFLVKLVQ